VEDLGIPAKERRKDCLVMLQGISQEGREGSETGKQTPGILCIFCSSLLYCLL